MIKTIDRIYAVLYLLCAAGPLIAVGIEGPIYSDNSRIVSVLLWYGMLILGGVTGFAAAWNGDLRSERIPMIAIVFALGSYAMAVSNWGAGLPNASLADTITLLIGVALFGPIRLIWHIEKTNRGVKLLTYRPLGNDAQ